MTVQEVVRVATKKDEDEIMLMSKNGIVIRIPAKDISKVGRNTQGVRLMRLEDDKIIGIARVVTNNHNNS